MDISKIQWCDSTINPVMGCGGCELYPSASEILSALDDALMGVCGWANAGSREIFNELCQNSYDTIAKPHPAMQRSVTTTNIWHLRKLFYEKVHTQFGTDAAQVAQRVIEEKVTCYAAKLHLNKGASILKPMKKIHAGHAPVFNKITLFEGRLADAAEWKDLKDTRNPRTPWKDDLPRLIFVSDMGDALSRKQDFPFLKNELIPNFTSENGRKHIWIWLTKRPHLMKEFAREVGGLPPNVCAMSTLTSPNDENLIRLSDLKDVQGHMKGLSMEPIWERIPPEQLDLTGIDWVIVGGESGSVYSRKFPVEWAMELRDHCKEQGVAFFCKQWGKFPTYRGEALRIKDSHGGDWSEWDKFPFGQDLKIRQFPAKFYEYRKGEPGGQGARPSYISKSEKRIMNTPAKKPALSPKQTERFETLNKVVLKASKGVVDAALAMAEIQKDRLYRDRFSTFAEYCEEVHKFSRQYGVRLAAAGNVQRRLTTQVVKMHGNIDELALPVNEAQLTALGKVKDDEQLVKVYQEALTDAGGDPAKLSSSIIKEKVSKLTTPSAPAHPRPPSPSARLREAQGLLRDLRTQLEAGADTEEILDRLEELLGA